MSKTSSGFSKVWKLISVLQKCNGSGVIGSKDALISPMVAKVLAAIGLVLLTGAIGLVIALAARPGAPHRRSR